MSEEKTPPWKSLLFALAGAYGIFCSIYLYDRMETSEIVVFAIWGGSFWVGGTGNLFVDRRQKKEGVTNAS